MKKTWKSLACGICAAGLLASLSIPAFAAQGGQVAYNQAGIMRFGEVVLKPGTSTTAPNGQSIPSVITYTDSSGGTTNYLPIRKVAEMVDANISWNASKKCVSIGNSSTANVITDPNLTSEADFSGLWQGQAVLGTKIDCYTEVDPAIITGKWDYATAPSKMNAAIENGLINYEVFGYADCVTTVSVTNHSSDPQLMTVYRIPTVSDGSDTKSFTHVRVAPGQTITRAFRCDADADVLHASSLRLTVTGENTNVSDITVEIIAYSYDTEHVSEGITVTNNRAVLPEVNHAA